MPVSFLKIELGLCLYLIISTLNDTVKHYYPHLFIDETTEILL